MGTHCSSELYRGHTKVKNCHKMKLLLLTALAAVAVAEPYYGYGYYGFPYGHQQAWPSVRAPGFSSTCFGCRGKRSAEAEAEPAYGFYGYHPYAYYGLYRPYVVPALGDGVAGHPGGATSFSHRSPQGLGKRSADEAAPAEADKVFGSGHNSYVGQTVWGFPSKAKRSAEAEPEAEAEAEAAPYYYGYYGHQLNWPSYYAPGFSSTVWGARGKRSAEPAYGYYGYPYGYYGYRYGPGIAGHPSGTSYTFRSPQGLGK